MGKIILLILTIILLSCCNKVGTKNIELIPYKVYMNPYKIIFGDIAIDVVIVDSNHVIIYDWKNQYFNGTTLKHILEVESENANTFLCNILKITNQDK